MIDEPFRGTDALAAGRLTRYQLGGPGYRRLFPDVYLAASVEPDLIVRSRAAYLLVREQDGVLAGYSASALLGAECAPRGVPAEVRAPVRIRAHPGLRADRARVDPVDVIEVTGCRVTSARRTAWDLARRLPLVEAVVAVDALARRGRFDPAELLARRAERPGARGCRRLDEVVRLADRRAGSPPETRLRLALVRAGLPPAVQYLVVDEYGFGLRRVDLAYPEARLAIEYDGAYHYDRPRGEADRQRDAELAVHGWQTLRVGRDGMVSLSQTVDQVRRLLGLRSPRRTEWRATSDFP